MDQHLQPPFGRISRRKKRGQGTPILLRSAMTKILRPLAEKPFGRRKRDSGVTAAFMFRRGLLRNACRGTGNPAQWTAPRYRRAGLNKDPFLEVLNAGWEMYLPGSWD
jgi:hypothetical protein